MQVYLLTRNAKLVQTVMDIMESSESRYFLSVHEDVGSLQPRKTGAGVIIIDSDLPTSGVMRILERRDRDLFWLANIVLISGELAHKEVPGFEGSRHLVLPVCKDVLLSSIFLETAKAGQGPRACRIGKLTFNTSSRKVFVEDEILRLTRKEYDVLEILATNGGMVVSKKKILDTLYDGVERPGEKIVDVFICKIRSKIKKLTGGDGLIDTVWGSGYMLVDLYVRPHARSDKERLGGRASDHKWKDGVGVALTSDK